MADRNKERRSERWDAEKVRALREYMDSSQRALADELGVRQQTVSEWETGLYAPRGASKRLLSIVAEEAGFRYKVGGDSEDDESSSGSVDP